MASRSISSRKTNTIGSSCSYTAGLTRSQGTLSSPRSAYSFSSGFSNLQQGYNFSNYIASSSSCYSSLSNTPLVVRRKSSGLSREEYKTRSKSVDASLYLEERAGGVRRSHSTEDGRERTVKNRDPPQTHSSVSRASSVLPDLQAGEEDQEGRVREPVRNRQSHGVSQYDLERAATWALIGSNKSQPPPSDQSTSSQTQTSHIDYKKVSRISRISY